MPQTSDSRRKKSKVAPKTLLDSERRYRRLFESSPIILCEMDITGLLLMAARQKGQRDDAPRILKDRWREVRGGIRLTGMNAAGRKFFGVGEPAKESNGRMSRAEAVLADLLAGDLKCILLGKEACRGQSSLDMDDNGLRSVEWCWTRSAGDDGSDTCLVSLVDITDRKRAEEALFGSESRYRALVENIHLGINLVDRDHRILMANATTCKLFQKSPAALVGKRCFREFEKRGRVCSHCPGTVAMATNQPTEIEREVVRYDGVRHWVRIQAFPVLDTDGQAEAFIEVVEDITDRKRAQEALKASEEKYRQIFATETDGIFLVHAQTHRFLDVNDAVCRMYGYNREEFLNLNHLDTTAQPEESARSIVEVVREKRVFVALRYHRKKDGTAFPVEVSASSFVLQGQPVICGVIRDITRRQLSEDALRETEAQLRQAQKMEAVGQLAGGVAHDFRNQLTVIKGYGEMLLRRSLVKDEGKEPVEQILQAADRSAAIAGQLLAFSRQQVLRPETVSLDVLAGDMMKSVAKTLGEDIHLSIMPCGDLWNVCLDTGQFQQALLNLVLNARDAMPKGGQLRIETRNIVLNEGFVRGHVGASRGPHVILTIRDTGTGMDAETLRHVFEPFYTTKRVGEGTGLGLAMVHGFVAQSGGFIEVQSQPRHGTTFHLYFPAVENVAESAGTAAQATDLPKGSGTILVVEDEDAIRRMLLEMLGECGYTVLPVGNAQNAMTLILAARQKIDLLITDVVMPGWSGPELAKHFRAVRPGVPVLLISGHAGKTLTGHGVIPADVNLLTKPFTSETLASTVRALLRQARKT